MSSSEKLKTLVREKYSEIALQGKIQNQSSCCGAGPSSTQVYNIMTDSYEHTQGYNPDADLGLGCGLPTAFARIHPGDTVLDLGSGAGNDCFVARHSTGDTGKIIGVDFTPAMIEKARLNAEKLGYNNVEFRQGDIEELPVSSNSVNVVVSNCVLNLVPDKPRVFQEIFRVLRPGGHFSISDIVLEGDLPEALSREAELYAGCVSGAIQKERYLELIRNTGFEELRVEKEKAIHLPDDVLRKYLEAEDLEKFRSGNIGIFSISVFAIKPANGLEQPLKKDVSLSCAPGSGCC